MPTATSTGTCYETTLHVELGDNPNRPRPGRDWLANPYRVHQRIMWALDGQTDENRPLFRIYRDRVIVRTSTQPDWRRAFLTPPHAAPFLLLNGEIPEARPETPELNENGCYWFDILFCPPHRTPPGEVIGTKDGKPKRERGKRIVKVVRDKNGRIDEKATRDKQLQTFVKRLTNTGFEPASDESVFVMDRFLLRASKGRKRPDTGEAKGTSSTEKRKRMPPMQAHVALITGQLKVTDDPKAAFRTLMAGIGPAKSLGCGMLILGNTAESNSG